MGEIDTCPPYPWPYWPFPIPPPPPPWDGLLQIVINPEQLETALEKGFTFVSQLQKGSVVVQKRFTQAQIFEAGMAAMKTTAADVMKAGARQLRVNAAKELR